MFNKQFIDAGDIAKVLGWSRAWFMRRRGELIDRCGFPSALPSGRWHAESVANWIRNYGDAATAARQAQIGMVRAKLDRTQLERAYLRAVA